MIGEIAKKVKILTGKNGDETYTIYCPICNSVVSKFFPVYHLNGDTSWGCDDCGHRFEITKDGEIK
jgi:transcription elongation factor Elf1